MCAIPQLVSAPLNPNLASTTCVLYKFQPVIISLSDQVKFAISDIPEVVQIHTPGYKILKICSKVYCLCHSRLLGVSDFMLK